MESHSSVCKHLHNCCFLPHGTGSLPGPSVAIYGAGVDLVCCWNAHDEPTMFLKPLEHSVVEAPSLGVAPV